MLDILNYIFSFIYSVITYHSDCQQAIVPAVAAALIGGGASVLGGLLGGSSSSSAQRSANRTNLQIARETNQQNWNMMTYQNQWNEAQNEKMLAYNTPLEQMKRYDQAGINPYLAASQIVPGNQQSQLTSAQAPAMQAAQVQPVTGMADAIQNSISSAADSMLKIAQARDINMDSELKRLAFDSDLVGRKFRNKSDEYDYKLKKQGYDFNFEMQPLQKMLTQLSITQTAAQTKNVEQQTKLLEVQTKLADFDLGFKNKHAEERFKAELANIISQTNLNDESAKNLLYDRTVFKPKQLTLQAEHNKIDLMNATTNRYNASTNRMNAETNRYNAVTGRMDANTRASVAAQEIIKSAEETIGIKLSNDQRAKLEPIIIESAEFDASSKASNAKIQKFREEFKEVDWFLDKVFKTVHAGSSVVGAVAPFL